MTKKAIVKTHDVIALLRKRYCAPEWAIMFEVADATGAQQNRYADAVAMNLWPSRGLAIHGFEVKVSRSDWLREIKHPEKSVSVQRYCHHWWVVAPDGVIVDGELPMNWGHIRATPKTLKVITDAPKLDVEPVNSLFVASMLRRASGADAGVIANLVNERVEEIRNLDQISIDLEIRRRTALVDRQTALITEIEKATGLDITKGFFSEPDFAQAVAMVHRAGVAGAYSAITQLERSALELLKNVDEARILKQAHRREQEAAE